MKPSLRSIPFIVVAILVVSLLPAASPSRATTFTSASAKSLATLLENHYRDVRTLRALFLERYSEGGGDARIESGAVYFERPGRMRWDYELPEKKVFVSDGKLVWFYVPADHTVTRVPVKESTDWRQPLALLTGKADLSKLCQEVSVQGPAAEPPGNVILKCVPKGESNDTAATGRPSEGDANPYDASADFTEVLLQINAKTGELARVQVRQKGGIELEYSFGGWEENASLPDALFHFEPPAGVAIVDGAGLGSTLQ